MKKLLAGAIAMVIGGIAAAWYWGLAPSGRRANAPDSAPMQQTRTEKPARRDFKAVARWMGKVESKEAVRIVALEEGEILSVEVEDGARVAKGSPLFVFGGSRWESRLAAAKEDVSSLRRRVALADQAERRKKAVVEKMIAKQDELNAAEAHLATLEAELKTAMGVLERLCDATEIRTPVAGVFTRRVVSVGQYVDRGAVLAEVIDPTRVRVAAALLAPENVPIQGRAATVRTPSGAAMAGAVVKVLPERTPAGGAIVWIEGDDLNRRLGPGEAVSGRILLSVHKAAIALPESAIVRDADERPYVFLKRPDGYHRQAVQTGLLSEGWVEIASGVRDEDDVVVQGAYELFYRDFSSIYKVAD